MNRSAGRFPAVVLQLPALAVEIDIESDVNGTTLS